jgi:hypothetical protein
MNPSRDVVAVAYRRHREDVIEMSMCEQYRYRVELMAAQQFV